ncbi:MAG: hypothetical protein WBA20_21580, partial [Ketobacter sp.]
DCFGAPIFFLGADFFAATVLLGVLFEACAFLLADDFRAALLFGFCAGFFSVRGVLRFEGTDDGLLLLA